MQVHHSSSNTILVLCKTPLLYLCEISRDKPYDYKTHHNDEVFILPLLRGGTQWLGGMYWRDQRKSSKSHRRDNSGSKRVCICLSSRMYEIRLTNPVSYIKAANRRSIIQDTLTELAVEGISLYRSRWPNFLSVILMKIRIFPIDFHSKNLIKIFDRKFKTSSQPNITFIQV